MSQITNYHWIPLDIVECILQQLANVDDLPSLRACACVCKNFTHLSQKPIFTRITLSDYAASQNSITPMHRLDSLLRQKPQICDYIRILDYEHHTNSNMPESFVEYIFHQLQSVTTLRLTFRVTPQIYDIPSWSSINSSFQNALFSFLSSNNIYSLTLDRINNVPREIFGHVSSLLWLTTDWVTLDSDSEPVEQSKISAPKLRSLLAERRGKAFAKALLLPRTRSLIDFSHLEDFKIHLDYVEPSMEIIKGIICQSDRLKSIYIDGSSPLLDMRDALSCLHAGSLKTLKSIMLRIEIDNQEQDPYCHLSSELVKISNDNVVEEIEVSICVAFDAQCTTELHHWSHLDEVLSQSGRFASLRRVDIAVYLCYFASDPKELETRMRFVRDNAFPSLSTCDQVEFSVNVETCLI